MTTEREVGALMARWKKDPGYTWEAFQRDLLAVAQKADARIAKNGTTPTSQDVPDDGSANL